MPGGAVSLLYFAWLRERVGLSAETVELPEGVATVGALIEWLKARGANYRSAFDTPRVVRCAVNQDFAKPEAAVSPGDEVAFFPPVTGG
jgi:molybdopterin synthase sulfur carrier subunit